MSKRNEPVISLDFTPRVLPQRRQAVCSREYGYQEVSTLKSGVLSITAQPEEHWVCMLPYCNVDTMTNDETGGGYDTFTGFRFLIIFRPGYNRFECTPNTQIHKRRPFKRSSTLRFRSAPSLLPLQPSSVCIEHLTHSGPRAWDT